MNKMKLIVLIVIGLTAAYFIVRAFMEPPFERLDRNFIDIADYSGSDPEKSDRKAELREWNFDIDKVYPTEKRRLVYHLDDENLVIWTGVVDLDDGLKFIYTPQYSKLIVIDRNDEKIVSNKLFLRDVTNAKIIDGYVYFVYGSFAKYKLGRYKLDE